jgi:RNA polymerase sigma-70 factor (ECF subfamily)
MPGEGRAHAVEMESDERRMVEAAQKDPGRFAELYEAHFHRVYAFVVRRLRDRQEAEDVTSEVFKQALTHIGRFEWRGVPFAAWLFRIAANALVDRAKRTARERGLEPPPAEPEPGPEEIEDRARLFRLVGELPREQSRVVVMRFGEEKTIREIAQELGKSVGAVKQLQLRALKGLRERMGRDDA